MDIAGALNAWQQRRLSRRRAVAERFGNHHDPEPLCIRRAVIYVASTDYVSETHEGYINPHLFRYPISVAHLELPA